MRIKGENLYGEGSEKQSRLPRTSNQGKSISTREEVMTTQTELRVERNVGLQVAMIRDIAIIVALIVWIIETL